MSGLSTDPRVCNSCKQTRTRGDFINPDLGPNQGAPMAHCVYCESKARDAKTAAQYEAAAHEICGVHMSRAEAIRHATRLGIEDLAGSHDVLQLIQWIREDKKRMRSHTMGATRATLRHYGIKVDDDEIDAALRFVLEFYYQISKFNVSW